MYSIDLTLHPSISHPSAPLRQLYSLYRTVSGSVDVFYPAQWQGTVEGSSLSGSVDLEWDGLEVVEDRSENGYRKIKAVRGHGEGMLGIVVDSGSVTLKGEKDK